MQVNHSSLNPEKMLSQTGKAIFSDLPMLHLTENKLEEVGQQYRKISITDQKEENVFESNEIPKDTIKF